MNFGIEGATGLKPGDFSNLLKASAAEIEAEGGESPPPGAAMEAAEGSRAPANPTAGRGQLEQRRSPKKDRYTIY